MLIPNEIWRLAGLVVATAKLDIEYAAFESVERMRNAYGVASASLRVNKLVIVNVRSFDHARYVDSYSQNAR